MKLILFSLVVIIAVASAKPPKGGDGPGRMNGLMREAGTMKSKKCKKKDRLKKIIMRLCEFHLRRGSPKVGFTQPGNYS